MPFDWFSSLLRFWAGGLASGTVFFVAGLWRLGEGRAGDEGGAGDNHAKS